MSIQELPVWSEEIVSDPVTESEQRRSLLPEEFLHGFLRQQTISTQQFNSLMFLLSSYAAPSPFCMYLWDSSKPIPDVAIEANGQATDSMTMPQLAEFYGVSLPNAASSAPVGFTYLLRKQ